MNNVKNKIDAVVAEIKSAAAAQEKKIYDNFNCKSGLDLTKCSSGELLDELMKRQGLDVWVFALRNDRWKDRELRRAIELNTEEIGNPEEKIHDFLFTEYQKPFEDL